MAGNVSSSEYVMADVENTNEQDRPNIQHQLWYLSLNGNLHKTTLSDTSEKINIIDIGTGNRFIQHNANDSEWPFEQFHFIQACMVDAGVHDWPAFRETCFRHLVPGGRLELGHVTEPARSKLPEFDTPSASPFLNLIHLVILASKKGGLDYDVSSKYPQGLKDAGFDEVEETTILWPLGSWPQKDNERKIGVLSLKNKLLWVDTAAKFILTHQNFMGDEEANDAVQAGRDDLLQADKKHFYITMKLFTAKKPYCPA
ncbi:hypothetical protein INS49_007192 [Diaporthe citri]|uniref:uncharacterized protein n=1 Tax=Diaporthe citri TaxID=83186 RepID=UPI001C80242A|nr:uncharacterized protein INS49_007192 [Diaporthe citri]KAG6365581.1 hypothetical protein INS49_007192 [Diaporthe citri]